MSQQAVSADIIPNSAVRIFPQRYSDFTTKPKYFKYLTLLRIPRLKRAFFREPVTKFIVPYWGDKFGYGTRVVVPPAPREYELGLRSTVHLCPFEEG
jgi:hypothetical protein